MNSDHNPELIKRMINDAQRRHGGSFLHTTSGTGQSSGRFSGDRRFVNPYKYSDLANLRADPKAKDAKDEDEKRQRARATLRAFDADKTKAEAEDRSPRKKDTHKSPAKSSGHTSRPARNLSAPTSRVSSGFAPSQRRGPVV